MKKLTIQSSEEVGQGEDSGFASLAEISEVSKPSANLISTNMKLSNQPLLDDVELQKSTKPWKRSEAQHQLNEEYNPRRQELLYKRLKHLVSKSKFYSKILVDKIENSSRSNSNNEQKSSQQNNDTDEGYQPPVKKTKRIIEQNNKYNLGNYIAPDASKKMKKLNLSNDEIEQELNMNSDEETLNENKNEDFSLKYFSGELRDYQKAGLKWLINLFENGLNGILADEMGLGKTIQVIAMICYLIEKRQAGPFLIVVPLSTSPNWLSEFQRFAPEIPVIFLHGNAQKKKEILRKMGAKLALPNGYRTLPVVVTTYEVVLYNIHSLRRYNWRYVVIDEGQRIKNDKSVLSRVVRTLNSISRLILTGTPLQNNLAELWALLNFLMPDIFDDLAIFESLFDIEELENVKNAERFLKQEKEKHVIACLRDILKPFMLRREKDEVCTDIPKKKEVLVYTPITELQRELYLSVLKYDYEYLAMKKKESTIIPDNPDGTRPKRKCTMNWKYSTNDFNLNTASSQSSTSTMLTNESSNKVFTEPIKNEIEIALPIWKQFVNIDDTNWDYFIRVRTGTRTPIYKQIIGHPFLVRCPLDDAGLPAINEEMVQASGKLLVLDLMLKKLYSRGHKVLLFSTLRRLLDLVADYLSMRPWKFVRLDGSVSLKERDARIQQFNNDTETFLFLITTRAGGVGLNLAAADTVIMYDSDWNPQADLQAMARCHRIGQTRPVVIYKLCSRGTIDEVIIKRAESKRRLEKMVISKELEKLSFNTPESILELQKLLESTEHKIIKSENDVFTEAELDALLDRSDLLPKNQGKN